MSEGKTPTKKDMDELKKKTLERVSPETLPSGYDIETAVLSAWATIQAKTGKDFSGKKGTPLIKIVTWKSLCKAVVDMVLLGLHPEKEQCYFIPSGKWVGTRRQARLHVSYYGAKSIMLRQEEVQDVLANVIYGDDEFEYEFVDSLIVVNKHTQSLESQQGSIVGAYATIKWADDRPDVTDVMTYSRIHESWDFGSDFGHDDGSFEDDHCRKTVLNHVTKMYWKCYPNVFTAIFGTGETEDYKGESSMDDKATAAMDKPARGFPEDEDEDAETEPAPKAEPQPEPTPPAESQAGGDETPPEPEGPDQSPPQEDEPQQEEPSF